MRLIPVFEYFNFFQATSTRNHTPTIRLKMKTLMDQNTLKFGGTFSILACILPEWIDFSAQIEDSVRR